MKFSSVLYPIKIGSLELANRIIFSAVHLCYTESGEINDRILNFYKERAEGGMGMIIIGGCSPEQRGRVWVKEIMVDDDRAVPGLTRLAEVVHAKGVKIAAQLLHGGSSTHPFITKCTPVSASDMPSNFENVKPVPLTEEGILEVAKSYARATKRFLKSGFDAVELHGGMGYLINQFLSPLTNTRGDKYGGGVENRSRFVHTIMETIRGEVGNFPIILKLSGSDMQQGGLEIQDTLAMIPYFEKYGVDAFHVSPGWHVHKIFHLLHIVPSGAYAFASRRVKEVSSIPVITSARVGGLEQADYLIRKGYADIVAMTRPFLADPLFFQKEINQQGDYVQGCLVCNKGCFDYMLSMKPVTCVVNPRVGLEGTIEIKPALEKKRVLICGGGPAGLKAAEVAALRGHDVILVEKETRIGGQIRLASSIPLKGHYLNLIKYWEKQIENLNIDLHLKTPATRDLVHSISPDVIVLATGAIPIIPDIPGIQGEGVMTVRALLSSPDIELGKDVVIIGGGATGCEVALYLSQIGAMSPESAFFLINSNMIPVSEAMDQVNAGSKKITLIEMKDRIGSDLGRSVAWVIRKEVKSHKTQILLQTKVIEILCKNRKVTGVKVQDQRGEIHDIAAQSVILASGYKVDDSLLENLSIPGKDIYRIGDCLSPRTLLEAIHEGFSIGIKI